MLLQKAQPHTPQVHYRHVQQVAPTCSPGHRTVQVLCLLTTEISKYENEFSQAYQCGKLTGM